MQESIIRSNASVIQPVSADITNYSSSLFSGGFTGALTGAITNPVAGFYVVYGATDWGTGTPNCRLMVFTNGVSAGLVGAQAAEDDYGATYGRQTTVNGILSLPANTEITLRVFSTTSTGATTNGILSAYLLH